MNPTSISGGRDGEMGAQMGKYGRNKQKKNKKCQTSLEFQGSPIPKCSCPVPHSVTLFLSFLSLKKIKGFEYRARGNNMTF